MANRPATTIRAEHHGNIQWHYRLNKGQRTAGVSTIHIIYGKGGGNPEVRWRRHEDAMVHVRLSHAPRFDLNMDSDVSLFQVMDLDYEEFRILDQSTKILG